MIDQAIQGFFQKIDNQFENYKILKSEEKKRVKIQEFEKEKKKKRKLKKIN